MCRWPSASERRFVISQHLRVSLSNLSRLTCRVGELSRTTRKASLAAPDAFISTLHHHPCYSGNRSMVVRPWKRAPFKSRNLKIEVLFENDYTCLSSSDNIINLEIPLDTLSRALKSCQPSAQTIIRLTKKNNNAYLALSSTLVVTSIYGNRCDGIGQNGSGE